MILHYLAYNLCKLWATWCALVTRTLHRVRSSLSCSFIAKEDFQFGWQQVKAVQHSPGMSVNETKVRNKDSFESLKSVHRLY